MKSERFLGEIEPFAFRVLTSVRVMGPCHFTFCEASDNKSEQTERFVLCVYKNKLYRVKIERYMGNNYHRIVMCSLSRSLIFESFARMSLIKSIKEISPVVRIQIQCINIPELIDGYILF